MSAAQGINALRDILFEEEKKKYVELTDELSILQTEMKEALEDRQLPESEMNQVVERITLIMPEKLGPAITETLKVQIRESKDEVVQALYPILGQMIKKYIQREMEVLREQIDAQMENVFSLESLISRLKSLFSGVKHSQVMLTEVNEPAVEEIFIIEQDSGLLRASYSKNKTMDQDMIAGMLTAIKSFVKDAFSKENQDLETISYDSYSIYIQNFPKFYIAVVLSGVMNAAFKNKLDDTLLSFVKDVSAKWSGAQEKEIQQKITKYFEKL